MMLKSIAHLKLRLQTEQELADLEQELLMALCQPAIDASFFDTNSFAADWLDESCNLKASSFHASLQPLAQYYAGVNPALSAALWAIWHSLERMQFHRGFEAMSPAGQAADFVRYRSIVCNAIVQFADGDAFTFVSLGNGQSPKIHRLLATRALNRLRDYPKVA